jgi:hypothetical protein
MKRLTSEKNKTEFKRLAFLCDICKQSSLIDVYQCMKHTATNSINTQKFEALPFLENQHQKLA